MNKKRIRKATKDMLAILDALADNDERDAVWDAMLETVGDGYGGAPMMPMHITEEADGTLTCHVPYEFVNIQPIHKRRGIVVKPHMLET